MSMIQPLKDQIKEIDDSLLTLLEARFKLVKAVWDIKKMNSIELRDKRAESRIIEDLKSRARFNPIIIESLYTQIFEENERMYNK